MISLIAALCLSAAPTTLEEARKGPPASEMAKLFFLAGDLRKAIDTAKMGMKSDAVRCKALYPKLVEYEYLASHTDSLTADEAKAFFDWDRKISPATPGKLTAKASRRYIEAPLQLAHTALQGADALRAQKLVDQVLLIDPANADALALNQTLRSVSDAGNVGDAGIVRDAGPRK